MYLLFYRCYKIDSFKDKFKKIGKENIYLEAEERFNIELGYRLIGQNHLNFYLRARKLLKEFENELKDLLNYYTFDDKLNKLL